MQNRIPGCPRWLATVGAVLLCAWAAGCGGVRVQPPPPKAHPVTGLSTPSIAVLPFQSRDSEPGIQQLFRMSLYSHLCARPFRDIELSVVDARLDGETATLDGPDDAMSVGARVGADLLLTGQVLDFQRVYAGIYSEMRIEAAIEVWETGTGRRIWSDRHATHAREGGLPLNLLEIPLIGLRSGFNLRDDNKVRIVDALARHMAWQIPLPRSSNPDPGQTRSAFELQVHAFSDLARAEDTVRFLRAEGYPAYLKSGIDQDVMWHRVVLGPYESRAEALEKRAGLPPSLADGAFVRRLDP